MGRSAAGRPAGPVPKFDWDVPLLKQVFWVEDVQLIRLDHMVMEDIVGWHYDKKHLFSVKSAYKVHRDVEGRRTKAALGGSAGSSRRVN